MASSHETAVEALQVRLEGITAGVAGAAYTPDLVQRVNVFPDQLDYSQTTVYLVRPGEETLRLRNGDCFVDSDLEIRIVVARRYGGGVNPDAGRWQVAAELVSDVVAAILPDRQLGGAATNCSDFRVDYERWLDTWAVAEVRFILTHRHNRAGAR